MPAKYGCWRDVNVDSCDQRVPQTNAFGPKVRSIQLRARSVHVAFWQQLSPRPTTVRKKRRLNEDESDRRPVVT